jgi:serine/threonine-protein kinase
LTPKAFDLLVQLIERPGQLVGKQELMTALWPETFVEEANLTYTMSALRRVLGDGQDGNQYIQTVPTRGYRFVSPVIRKKPAVSITADRIPPGVASRRRRFPAIAVAAVAIAGLGGLFIASWAPWGDAVPLAPMQLSIELGAPATLPTTREAFALSADGTLLAFAARERENEAERLYVRRLAQPTATLIPGTEGASSPFFSPDAQWVAFFADLKLKKVPVTGGAVRTIADALNHRGGWWGEDDTIVFDPSGRTGLMRVSSDGGPVQPLTTLLDGEISHRFPQVLPGGNAVLYTASTEVDIGTGASLAVQPLPSGERIVVQPHGFFGRYTPSGHIVYMQESALFAVPFDRQRLEILGPPGRVIDGVTSDSSRGSAQLAVSEAGTLAYLPGQNLFDARPIAWMDRQGMMTSLRALPAHWSNAEFSPDGDHIAMDIRINGQTDIFVYGLARGTLINVTSGGGDEEYPVGPETANTSFIDRSPHRRTHRTLFPGSALMALARRRF